MSRRSTSAPTPVGPPNLWAATLIADSPLAVKSTGIWPTAWIASLCIGTSNSAATAASSAIGMMVPTSLLAHITDTSATSSWSCKRLPQRGRRDGAVGVDRQPRHLGAFVLDQPLHRVQHRVVLDGRGDDAATPRVGVAARPVDALDREVVALGAARGEDRPPTVARRAAWPASRAPPPSGDAPPGPSRAATTRCRPSPARPSSPRWQRGASGWWRRDPGRPAWRGHNRSRIAAARPAGPDPGQATSACPCRASDDVAAHRGLAARGQVAAVAPGSCSDSTWTWHDRAPGGDEPADRRISVSSPMIGGDRRRLAVTVVIGQPQRLHRPAASMAAWNIAGRNAPYAEAAPRGALGERHHGLAGAQPVGDGARPPRAADAGWPARSGSPSSAGPGSPGRASRSVSALATNEPGSTAPIDEDVHPGHVTADHQHAAQVPNRPAGHRDSHAQAAQHQPAVAAAAPASGPAAAPPAAAPPAAAVTAQATRTAVRTATTTGRPEAQARRACMRRRRTPAAARVLDGHDAIPSAMSLAAATDRSRVR